MSHAIAHPILAALGAMLAIIIVLVIALCPAASKPMPRVDWDKDDYKR